MSETTPVDGPVPITVTRFAGGAELGVAEWLANIIVSLVDDDDLHDEFMAIVEDRAISAERDGSTPDKFLVETLAEKLGRIRLYDMQARGVGASLIRCAEANAGSAQAEAGAA